MIAYLPIPGGHIKLAERFVDPAFSFTMGWNYWYNWTIILPAELSAAAVLINFWNKDINNSAWIIICLVVVVAINFMGAGVFRFCFKTGVWLNGLVAGAYGEAEFIFASIKVLTIVGKLFYVDICRGADRHL